MGTPESQLRLRKTDQNPSADQNSLSSSSNPGRGPIGSDYNRPIFKLGIVSLSMFATRQSSRSGPISAP
ncbi:hypothetical protein PGTUg99_011574 [Puccinia graminis f. sp. tritici]|uniref:Uncharacterized protein n=1 Tax=Puccinia graminis f. sp. tritici TaxID=56615 RepID=A0A5B0RPS3_PUCGR|nr:hypothetical protein PGTUg99_011574 [Puccinia graminis f. sp. tritici]